MTSSSNIQAGTFSQVREQFLKALQGTLPLLQRTRVCPNCSDADWLYQGIERVLSTSRSGRDFIQSPA